MDYSTFCIEADLFLKNLFQEMSASQIQIEDHWMIDHLCFRVETQNEYETYQKFFLSFSTLLIESPVNGRMISTYKLNEPICIDHHQIWVVELPAPKLSKKVQTGFEHIEVVFDLSFEEIEKQLSHCHIDKSGLAKDFNKELEIKLQTGSLKFHHLSLESVIRLEKNKKFFSVIQKSDILNLTSAYSPLIAGTALLGVATNQSDLDILLYSNDLQAIYKFAQKELTKRFDLKIKTKRLQGQDSLIIQFNFLGINFELFAQNTHSHNQLAYRHFQIEERLLMLGGTDLLNKVTSLRDQGLKTEPAFALAIGIHHEDAYTSLLQLQKLSEEKIIEKFFKPNELP